MAIDPLRIVSIGESTIDHYVDSEQEYVGGISLNFAVNAKRCGADRVSLVSRIGNDHDRRILNALTREGIDSSRMSILPGQTARQDILLDEHGNRIFPPGGYCPGVLQDYTLTGGEIDFVREHNVLALPLFKQVEALFYQVLYGIPFEGWIVADFLDLSDYNRDTRILQLNMDGLTIAFISGNRGLTESLRPLSLASNCMIVVTMGAEGSIALFHGELLYQPAIPVANVIDSTGCGDAFQAAFTVSYWREQDPRKALQHGAEQAAIVVQHLGAYR